MPREPITERARGRWTGILPQLRIPMKFLNGRHQSCPICGGKDRARFDDRDGRGTFFCTHCGAGDGVKLLMLFHGWDFRQAASEIDAVIGEAKFEAPKPERTAEQNRRSMNDLWRTSSPLVDGDVVSRYLSARGLGMPCAGDLRAASVCRHTSGNRYPALLAMVRSGDGKPCQLHRTFLTEDGCKAPEDNPRLLMPGKIAAGSAVRLGEPGAVLGIAEGIETALSASELLGVPVWAALNTSLMASWRPPEGVEEVIVFGDNDENFAGQKAAFDLSFKLSSIVKVRVEIPDRPGADWNDVLTSGRSRAAEFAGSAE